MHFFKATAAQQEQLLISYHKTENEILNLIEKIKNWIKNESHLPDIDSEDEMNRIRSMLFANHLDVEQTQKQLDNYYSIRHVTPDLFENHEPLCLDIMKFSKSSIFFPLPELTADFERVYIWRLVKNEEDNFNLNSFLKRMFAMFELTIISDTAKNDVFVLDFDNITTKHIVHFTPRQIYKGYIVYMRAYGGKKLKCLHFLNVPKIAYSIVQMFNAIMSTNTEKKVRIHKNLESLHYFVPKNVLPKEYGGTFKHSADEINTEWKSYFYKHNNYIKSCSEKKSDESKRTGEGIDKNILEIKNYDELQKLEID